MICEFTDSRPSSISRRNGTVAPSSPFLLLFSRPPPPLSASLNILHPLHSPLFASADILIWICGIAWCDRGQTTVMTIVQNRERGKSWRWAPGDFVAALIPPLIRLIDTPVRGNEDYSFYSLLFFFSFSTFMQWFLARPEEKSSSSSRWREAVTISMTRNYN